MSGNEKRKVIICPNLQCVNRVNAPNATTCAECGFLFRGINCEWLYDEEIEKRIHPEKFAEAEEIIEESAGESEESSKTLRQQVIICPSCNKRTPYRVGLEFCECGEYIQEEEPVFEEEVQDTACEMEQETRAASCEMREEIIGFKTLDDVFMMKFEGDYAKIGRLALGGEYFLKHGKNKVCREHAILRRIDGEVYISYCKKDERNYLGGVDNPIFINKKMLGNGESCRLQVGDIIAFSELDTTDPQAAFFKVV